MVNLSARLSAGLSGLVVFCGMLSGQVSVALSLPGSVACEEWDRTGVIIAANDIFSQGFRHQIRGKPDAALNRLALALTMFQVIDEPEGEAHALTGIASIHRDLGHDEQSLNYFKQALAVQLEIRAYSPAVRSLTNMGALYARLHHYDDAIRTYQDAILLTQKIGDRPRETQLRQRIHELDS